MALKTRRPLRWPIRKTFLFTNLTQYVTENPFTPQVNPTPTPLIHCTSHPPGSATEALQRSEVQRGINISSHQGLFFGNSIPHGLVFRLFVPLVQIKNCSSCYNFSRVRPHSATPRFIGLPLHADISDFFLFSFFFFGVALFRFLLTFFLTFSSFSLSYFSRTPTLKTTNIPCGLSQLGAENGVQWKCPLIIEPRACMVSRSCTLTAAFPGVASARLKVIICLWALKG